MSERTERRPVVVVVNPTAGLGAARDGARGRAEQAAAFALSHGSEVEVVVTTQSGHARELAASAVRRGAQMVVAWGGDGTINEVAASLAFSECVLGVVPAGSGNGLARELSIPLEPRAAFDAVMAGVDRRIDVGTLDGRVFVNVAGVGLDARVAQRFAEIGRNRRGMVGYARAALREVAMFKPDNLTLELDGGRHDVRPLFVAFANGRQYGNGAIVAPDARIDDGRLHVVVVTSRSTWGILRGMPAFFSGRIHAHPGVTTYVVADAYVSGAGPMLCHVDGEPHMAGSRVEVRVQAGALTVRVPARQ